MKENKLSLAALQRVTIQPGTIFILGVSAIFVLGISHHAVNFWGLRWEKQFALLVVLVPWVAVVLNFLLPVVWETCIHTSWKRSILFLLPVLVIASYLTWRNFESPQVKHELEVGLASSSPQTAVQLMEIKDTSASIVKFSEIKDLGGWAVEGRTLILSDPAAAPLRYSFVGPLYKPVKLTFISSPSAATVRIVLDGKTLESNLLDAGGGQKTLQISPSYRFRIPGGVMDWLTIILDMLMFMLLFTLLWLIQEVPQQTGTSLENRDDFRWGPYWKGMKVLLLIALLLHAFNYFSAPLILSEDSPGYLDGAVYWAKYHTLDGASSIRGPGTTFLFLPVILLFDRNPWGLKLLLHLLAFASVPLSYHLGWQLSKRYWFAFLAGLFTIFTPDLFSYSNYAISEVPNIFFVLLFCVVLLSTIGNPSLPKIIATMLIGSFATLVRTENLVLLILGALFLGIPVLQKFFSKTDTPARKTLLLKQAGYISFAVFLAAIPILAWSAHNHKNHGFWGLSNYAGEVFYTGWVYEGEASHIPITNASSPSVQIIREAYWNSPKAPPQNIVPTGWNIHPFLIDQGYTSQEAFSILKQAALDSITHDYLLTLQVLNVKIQDSFTPEPVGLMTLLLPGEVGDPSPIKSMYFDEERPGFPSLVLLQRKIYDVLGWYYYNLYPAWAWFCVGSMLLCLYRRPVMLWLPITLITLFRVGLPNLFGLSHWRFTVSGLPLMQILALAGLHSLFLFFQQMKRSFEINSDVRTAFGLFHKTR